MARAPIGSVSVIAPLQPERSPAMHAFRPDAPSRIDRMAIANLSPHDRLLFERFGSGPIDPLPHHTLHAAFESWAATQPATVAVEHLGRSITYGELNRRAERLAAALYRRGVRRGDAVGLYVQRSIPMVVGMLATLKLGAAYAPQHIGVAPEAQLRHITQAIDAPVILTMHEFADLVPTGTGAETVVIEDELHVDGNQQQGSLRPQPDVDPDDRCFILFTSGTTGPPNGVQVTHRNVANIVLTEPGNLGIKPGVRVAQILSIAFDMAQWEVLGALGNGGTLVVRGDDFQEVAESVDVIIATPTVLGSIDASEATNVGTVAVAGEPCPRALADEWSAFATFYNSCGPTETTIINTAKPYRVGDEHLTIGSPTPNNTVYVLDEHRRPLPIGEIGEMWAGGDCVTAGYLDNDELTAERYAPDPFLGGGRRMFRTRDLGRWTADGALEHFGRTDDQVKIRGFRLELDSVSTVIEAAPGVRKAVTVKVDDRTLASFATPASVDAEQAKEAVAAALPYYCVPEIVLTMDQLPATPRGKVDRRLLLAQAKLALAASADERAVTA